MISRTLWHLFLISLLIAFTSAGTGITAPTDSSPSPDDISLLRQYLRQVPPDHDGIVDVLQRDRSLVHQPIIGSATLLSWLCQGSDSSSLQLVRLLCEQYGAELEGGLDADAIDRLHPLIMAVKARAPALVRYLLTRHPDPSQVSQALALAAAGSSPSVLQALVRYATSNDTEGGAALSKAFLAAASQSRLNAMQTLADADDAVLDARDTSGATAAHLVVGHGQNKFYAPLDWLLERRPQLLGVGDNHGHTALDLLRPSIMTGRSSAFVRYLEGGAMRSGSGAERMQAALTARNPNAVVAAIDADPWLAYAALDSDGRTALQIVAGSGRRSSTLPSKIAQFFSGRRSSTSAMAIAQILVENGAELDVDGAGRSPLLAAVEADDDVMIQYLLRQWKIDDVQVVAALGAAVRRGRDRALGALVAYLVETGPTALDLGADDDGLSAFQAAAARADLKQLQTLYETGRVNGRQCDADGNTVAHLAAASTAPGRALVLSWMQSKLGADLLTVKNRSGRTASDLIGDTA